MNSLFGLLGTIVIVAMVIAYFMQVVIPKQLQPATLISILIVFTQMILLLGFIILKSPDSDLNIICYGIIMVIIILSMVLIPRLPKNKKE